MKAFHERRRFSLNKENNRIKADFVNFQEGLRNRQRTRWKTLPAVNAVVGTMVAVLAESLNGECLIGTVPLNKMG
jgi:hypothetical protein